MRRNRTVAVGFALAVAAMTAGGGEAATFWTRSLLVPPGTGLCGTPGATVTCAAPNGTGSTTCDALGQPGPCVATACTSGFHAEAGSCTTDTRGCTPSNATAGTQVWSGTAWGACTATACATGYHLAGSACAPDQTPPTGLALAQAPNARGVALSWTAGTGNGGAGGCRVEVAMATGWSGLGTANCDAASTGAAFALPGDGWKAAWGGTQLRLVRQSDGAVLGAFPQALACAPRAGSATPTPEVDENCDGRWDEAVGGTIVGTTRIWYADGACGGAVVYSDTHSSFTATQGYKCVDEFSAWNACIPLAPNYCWAGPSGDYHSFKAVPSYSGGTSTYY